MFSFTTDYYQVIDELIVNFAHDLNKSEIKIFRQDFYRLLIHRLITHKIKSFSKDEMKVVITFVNDIDSNTPQAESSISKIMNLLVNKDKFQSELSQEVAGIFNDLAR